MVINIHIDLLRYYSASPFYGQLQCVARLSKYSRRARLPQQDQMSRRSRHFNHIQRWVPSQRAKKREAGARDSKLAAIIYLVNFFQKEHMEMTVLPRLFNIAAFYQFNLFCPGAC